MSHFHDSHCPSCKKPFRRHDHFDRCDHCGHFDRHDHFDDFRHHRRFHDDFICERFICDDRFKVRLGGLQGGLNFRLRQLIDCEVKMEVECGEDCEEIHAKICFVGSDFIEVKVLDKNKKDDDHKDDDDCKKKKKKRKKDDFLIIKTEHVKWFKLKDDCDCHDHHHHDCDCDCHKHHDCCHDDHHDHDRD